METIKIYNGYQLQIVCFILPWNNGRDSIVYAKSLLENVHQNLGVGNSIAFSMHVDTIRELIQKGNRYYLQGFETGSMKRLKNKIFQAIFHVFEVFFAFREGTLLIELFEVFGPFLN